MSVETLDLSSSGTVFHSLGAASANAEHSAAPLRALYTPVREFHKLNGSGQIASGASLA